MNGRDAKIHLSRKDLDLNEKNLARPRLSINYAPTPEEHRRREFRRGQRRDAGRAFLIIAGLLVLLTGGGMVLVAWLEGRL